MGRIAILLMTLLALSGGAADKAVAEVAVETADRDMLVARYYVGRRDYSGAINRFRIVVTKFKSSEYIEEALASLAEAYLELGVDSEAGTATAVLARKFPSGAWTERARSALKSAGVEPAENPHSWISRAFQR